LIWFDKCALLLRNVSMECSKTSKSGK